MSDMSVAEMPTTEYDKALDMALILRQSSKTLWYLAHKFEAESVDFPYYTISVNVYRRIVTINIHVWGTQDDEGNDTTLASLKRYRKIIGGTFDKEYNTYSFSMTREIDPGIFVKLEANREKVCTRTVIATKMVEEVDYENAPKKLVPQEIVEWHCNA